MQQIAVKVELTLEHSARQSVSAAALCTMARLVVVSRDFCADCLTL
jgi:hypothetical protein